MSMSWQAFSLYWRPSLSIGLAVLCFTQKRVFGPRTAKSQPIWIKFCTPIVVRNTLVGRLRPRSARGGSRPNQNDYVFVILVTHPKSYIEMTDCRNFGGKPSKWRWGRVLSWKIPEFCSVGRSRSKTAFFRVFRVPFDYPAYSLQESYMTPNQWYRWKADSDGVPFANLESLTRHLADIGHMNGAEVVTWPSRKLKFAYRHA